MPLVPILVGTVAVLVMCAGAVVALANVLLWESALGRPEATVVSCVVEEHKVPFPTEAGFAQVTIKVSNASSEDAIYLVGVAVKSAKGDVVGTVEHRIGVPAGHDREQTWRVTLTKQGGRDCEVTKVEEA